MLMPIDQRGAYRWNGRCPDCDGCIDDRCGGCSRRFCGGTYAWMQWGAAGDQADSCDRCPNKVDKRITDNQNHQRTIRVRCNATTGHPGTCHWDPNHAGRTTP